MFKIITSHPVGRRTFTYRADAERVAIAFGIPVTSIAGSGATIPHQRSK